MANSAARVFAAPASIALLCIGVATSGPAAAGEEIVHRELPWMTQCKIDDATREKNCSIWRLLASRDLKLSTPKQPVLVIKAVDDYAFVQIAPYVPRSIAIDGNPPFTLEPCLEPTVCFLAAGNVPELRRQLENGADMVVAFQDKDEDATTVMYDLAGYQKAIAAAKLWLSR